MHDLDLIAALTKNASKAKATVLQRYEIRKDKTAGWVIHVNGQRTGAYGRYATAELGALIMGAAPWQLDAIWNDDIGEPRMDHAYPHLTRLQKLSHDEYVAYLQQYQ